MNDLFRKEVLDQRASRHMGRVFLKSPRGLAWASFLIAAIFVLALLIGFSGQYTPRENLYGKLVLADDGSTQASAQFFVSDPDIILPVTDDVVLVHMAEPAVTEIKAVEGQVTTVETNAADISIVTVRLEPNPVILTLMKSETGASPVYLKLSRPSMSVAEWILNAMSGQ